MLHRNMTQSAAPSPVSSRAWFALAVLCLVYLMNFLDRTLIYILFPLIKKEMHFSDLELAALGSTSFVIFYTLLGIPFGRLADRVNRKRMIAAGLVTWSLFSGLTGFANDFWTIFFCRVMVGVGEATLGPAATSLLSDLFPKERRGTVQSIYSAGIPLGAAAAFFVGAQIGQEFGWRWAFYLLGFPGVALALVVLTLPEAARGSTEGAASQQANADPRQLLWARPLYWHVFGYAMMAVAANSLSIWIPSFLVRFWEMPLTSVGTLTGLSMAIAGGLATGFGGAGADLFRRKSVGGRMQFSALLALICAPLWLGLIWAGTVELAQVCFFLLAGLGLAWLGPAAADVHDIVGPKLRGLGIAVYFFVVNALGYGIAPLVVGALSDTFGVAENPGNMRYALTTAPLASLIAALLLWRGSRALVRQPR